MKKESALKSEEKNISEGRKCKKKILKREII
jgi:hypothetical protein